MPTYLATFMDGLLTRVGEAWPETVPNGIYQSIQAARVTLDRKAEDAELPFAVIETGIPDEGEWGIGNQVDEYQVAVYYVTDDSLAFDQLDGRLEALRDRLKAGGLPSGQVASQPRPSHSIQLPLAGYFAGTRRPFVTAALLFRAIVGETP